MWRAVLRSFLRLQGRRRELSLKRTPKTRPSLTHDPPKCERFGDKILPHFNIFAPCCLRQSLNPVTHACFRQSLGLSVYQGRMLLRFAFSSSLLRAVSAAAMLVFGVGLSGCADMGDTLSTAFADPAKYDLYDCKQLETERKTLATRSAELQGLMAKADTGAAGPLVAELAYRNEYIAVRGQARFAEEAWQRSRCHPSPPAAPAAAAPEPLPTPPAPAKGARRPGAGVH